MGDWQGLGIRTLLYHKPKGRSFCGSPLGMLSSGLCKPLGSLGSCFRAPPCYKAAPTLSSNPTRRSQFHLWLSCFFSKCFKEGKQFLSLWKTPNVAFTFCFRNHFFQPWNYVSPCLIQYSALHWAGKGNWGIHKRKLWLRTRRFLQ